MDTTKQLKNVISFCSGYAGIERGLELAGLKLRTLSFVEIEAFAIANLVAKMESGSLDPSPVWSNLKTFPSHLFRDRVDILTGGYPCQPFSAAGKRAGKDDPRHLWPWIRQHIDTIRPVRCFFENVEGHITLGLREVIEDLEELGYKTTWGIFSASEVGAPHQRKRVFILADSVGSRQQALRNQSRPEWETGTVSQSSELADSTGEFGKRGVSEGVGGRESQEAIRNGGAFTSVADTDSFRYDRRPIPNEIRERALEIETQRRPEFTGLRSETEGRGDELADTSSEGLQGAQRLGTTGEEGVSRGLTPECSDQLADTISARSEIGLSGQERSNQERHSGIIDNCCGEQGGWQNALHWPPEPNVGRVVDGCADRVDRVRLLGNGVVPSTAAQAWTVLGKQLWQT